MKKWRREASKKDKTGKRTLVRNPVQLPKYITMSDKFKALLARSGAYIYEAP